MKHEILELQFTDLTSRGTRWVKGGVMPFTKSNPIFAGALLVALLTSIYWLFIASDRYVSEAHVIIQRTELTGGATTDFAGLLSGGSTANRGDQLILRDYLRSVDIVRKLDVALNLRSHYSNFWIDPFSRMESDPTIEELHRYYLSRVSIEYDEYTGVLVIKAEGFDPQTSQAITQALVKEGERFMNAMAHSLARDQVAFLERQVVKMNARAMDARQAVLNYQNRNGLVSPELAAETIGGIVAKLEAQRTELETQLRAMQSYLVPDHPNIVELEQQIDAINMQIEQERSKLTSPVGNRLNTKLEEFQRLEMQAVFAQEVYKTALVALEQGRLEATRTIKKMSVVQTPTLPEHAGEPQRIYKSILYAIVAMLIAGMAHLLLAIVRDHRD
jgi:capsular polysaccharide transport system permease protein